MPSPESRHTIDRRTVLEAGLALVCSRLLSGDAPTFSINKEIADISAFPRHRYNPRAIPVAPRTDQLSIAGNHRLDKIGQHDTALAVVHAGYTETTTGDVLRDAKRPHAPGWPEKQMLRTFRDVLRGARGEYHEYLISMGKLFEFLGRTALPVVCYNEERDAYNNTLPRASLTPPSNAFMLVTHNDTPVLVSDVKAAIDTQSGQDFLPAKQNPNLLYDALRKAGVKEIHMAGEYSFNLIRGGTACLGGAARTLIQQGFRVRGIREAVFPFDPSGIETNVLGVKEALYDNAISLAEVVGS